MKELASILPGSCFEADPQAGEAHSRGHQVVNVVNLSVIVGLPAGLAAYFIANRLIPVALADRAGWEICAFYSAWLSIALVGLVASLAWPRRQAWCALLALTAGLYAAVPFADIWMLALQPFRTTAHGDVSFVWFDGAMIVLVAAFALAARTTARRHQSEAPHYGSRGEQAAVGSDHLIVSQK